MDFRRSHIHIAPSKIPVSKSSCSTGNRSTITFTLKKENEVENMKFIYLMTKAGGGGGGYTFKGSDNSV